MPGLNTASMNCAVYDLPAAVGSGPISATWVPPAARQPDGAIVSSQTVSKRLDNDTSTVFAFTAAACVGYVSRCQNANERELPDRVGGDDEAAELGSRPLTHRDARDTHILRVSLGGQFSPRAPECGSKQKCGQQDWHGWNRRSQEHSTAAGARGIRSGPGAAPTRLCRQRRPASRTVVHPCATLARMLPTLALSIALNVLQPAAARPCTAAGRRSRTCGCPAGDTDSAALLHQRQSIVGARPGRVDRAARGHPVHRSVCQDAQTRPADRTQLVLHDRGLLRAVHDS